MRTVFPSGTGCEDSARQSSPWTRTIPSSPAFNSAVTVPWQPINSSFPVAVFHFRDRSTNFISTTAKTPNGSVADSATEAHASCRQRRADQEHRTQEHGNDSTKREDAVTWRFGFQNEKRQRQRNEEQSRQVHREEMNRVERQNQADSANHSRGDDAWMRELGVQPEHPENQQDKENIRLDNAREEPLPRG